MNRSARGSRWHRIVALESHHRLAAAVFVGAAVLALGTKLRLPMRVVASWDAYAACWLALAWARMIGANPRSLARVAKLTHGSRRVILLLVLTAACASLMAVIFLLEGAKKLEGAMLGANVGLAVTTVLLSWLVVHTVFALEYAYLYFRAAPPGTDAQEAGGLSFPGPDGHEPDYLDFAYFSFVIGMTSQVSDVQISSPQIRRWALLHGVVSFGFNTAVLALSINIVSGLL